MEKITQHPPSKEEFSSGNTGSHKNDDSQKKLLIINTILLAICTIILILMFFRSNTIDKTPDNPNHQDINPSTETLTETKTEKIKIEETTVKEDSNVQDNKPSTTIEVKKEYFISIGGYNAQKGAKIDQPYNIYIAESSKDEPVKIPYGKFILANNISQDRAEIINNQLIIHKSGTYTIQYPSTFEGKKLKSRPVSDEATVRALENKALL